MSDTFEPHDHAQEEVQIHDRLRGLALEAVAILREDLPLYFDREARRRFVDAPDFAASLDESDLGRLKVELREAGEAAASEVARGLTELEPWLSGATLTPQAGAGLEDNPALWEVVRAATAPLGALLKRHDFPADEGNGYALDYRAPRRFVSGGYMPTIAEKYWRCIADLKALAARRREAEQDSQRSRLARRWDEA